MKNLLYLHYRINTICQEYDAKPIIYFNEQAWKLAFNIVLFSFVLNSVQNLSLKHCGITDKGAVMIGRCLGSIKRSNVKLISLNLANNKITDAGLDEIAQVGKRLIYVGILDNK